MRRGDAAEFVGLPIDHVVGVVDYFGHISPHELFGELMSRERWTPNRLDKKPSGKREGWCGASAGAEAWLDEFITWRELGYNMVAHRDDYDHYESLPDWL